MPYKRKEDHARYNREHRNPLFETSEKRRAYKQAYYKLNKARILAKTKLGRFLRLYGVTPAQYDEMASAQPNCAICGLPAIENLYGKLYPDHCHTSGKVRELLCHKCNVALGAMQDDPERLEKAAAYLRKHQEK